MSNISNKQPADGLGFSLKRGKFQFHATMLFYTGDTAFPGVKEPSQYVVISRC